VVVTRQRVQLLSHIPDLASVFLVVSLKMNEEPETCNRCRIYRLLMFLDFPAFRRKQNVRPNGITSKALIVTVTTLITSNFTPYKVKYYKAHGKSNLNVSMVNHFE
jgi:hypothetical protein